MINWSLSTTTKKGNVFFNILPSIEFSRTRVYEFDTVKYSIAVYFLLFFFGIAYQRDVK